MQRLEVSSAVRPIYGSLGVKRLTAIGLSPGGSGYFTCIQNMKLVTTWEACSGNLESWEPSQHFLIYTGKPRKTCVEAAGRRKRLIDI